MPPAEDPPGFLEGDSLLAISQAPQNNTLESLKENISKKLLSESSVISKM
jgi:hypothetical protein